MGSDSTESFDDFEQRLASVPLRGAPDALRSAVLADAHRELAAARWDRRLARAAVVLLALGIGLNVAMGVQSAGQERRGAHVADVRSRQSLVNTAEVIAEATDARTGSHYARRLAVMIGDPLSEDEAAAIDKALHYSPANELNGKKG